MANAAREAVPFPRPHIFPAERNFTMRLVDGRELVGYVRRSDSQFAYAGKIKQLCMSGDKGEIFVSEKYMRRAQGFYEIDKPDPFVVIKKVKKTWLHEHKNENILSEISVAQNYGDDADIASLFDALEDNEHYYIIMPYFYQELVTTGISTPSDAEMLFRNLQRLKKLGILHCDISPENIMFSYKKSGSRTILIDFALAMQCAQDEHGQFLPIQVNKGTCGKLQFSSPEFLGHSNAASLKVLDFGVDMWAIGCILFRFWTGSFLYETRADASYEYFVLNKVDDRQVLENETVKSTLTLFKRLPQQQQNLLRRIFIHNPEDRVTVDDILDDPYFRQN